MSITIQDPYLSAVSKPGAAPAGAKEKTDGSAFQDALNAVQEGAKDQKENSGV